VGVEIDQAREASQLAEIDRSSARGSGEIRSDRDDPPALDEDPSVGSIPPIGSAVIEGGPGACRSG
jgi:hypothetical protein